MPRRPHIRWPNLTVYLGKFIGADNKTSERCVIFVRKVKKMTENAKVIKVC